MPKKTHIYKVDFCFFAVKSFGETQGFGTDPVFRQPPLGDMPTSVSDCFAIASFRYSAPPIGDMPATFATLRYSAPPLGDSLLRFAKAKAGRRGLKPFLIDHIASRLLILNCQFSIINSQLSIINYQFSILNSQLILYLLIYIAFLCWRT